MLTRDPSSSADVPPVVDRRTTPAGVLPRHIQAWSLLGLAGLMTLVLLLSGPTQPHGPKPTVNPALQTTDPNRARIEQHQRQIDEQAQRLAAERAELELAKRAMRDAAGNSALSRADQQTSPGPYQGVSGAPPADALNHERAQRDYRSLFLDSAVWSARGLSPANTVSKPPTPSASVGEASGSRTQPTPRLSPPPPRGARSDSTPSQSDIHPPQYVLREGTILEAVLVNRLDGQFVGDVNAMVTLPAYSGDREHVVIPAGSLLRGESRAVEHRGQSRLAVSFHRLLLPSGHDVSLDKVRGLNQVGDSGLQDQVDHHYWQVFGSALAIGALGGLAQGAAYDGDPSASDVYARGMANSFGQSATHVLDRFLNVLPTITIREGHRLRVYLSRDLWLPSAERIAAVPTGEVP